MTSTQDYIYRVSFKREQAGENVWTDDFYFTSLAAIYDKFTPDEIGCRVERLWNIGLRKGVSYSSKTCTITREPFYRKKNKTAPNGADNSNDDNLPVIQK